MRTRTHWIRPVRALAVIVPLVILVAAGISFADYLGSGLPTPGTPAGTAVMFHSTPPPAPDAPWPAEGQAAYAVAGAVHVSPGQHPVPIASLAKIMTAYVVLTELPSSAVIHVDASDVRDTERRRQRGESLVAVAEGEVLTRDQALEALLLPSANNIAAMLADATSGSPSRFVDQMNRTARALDMRDTTYADASGFDARTVSTAADQLVLMNRALQQPEFARITGMSAATIPVAGTVKNTDALLGRDGFLAGKTGSTAAAGGCFAFRVDRGGAVLTGVVLGQRGGSLIGAGLSSAQSLADAAYATMQP